MLVCVWWLWWWEKGGATEEGIQPEGPVRLIIESPNVSVFPGCFQGLLWMWEAKVMSERVVVGGWGGWNWEGFSCQEGKDTPVFGDWKPHHSPQLLMLARVWPEYKQKIGSVIQTQTGFHVPQVTLLDRRKWKSRSEVIYIFEGFRWRKALLIFLNVFFFLLFFAPEHPRKVKSSSLLFFIVFKFFNPLWCNSPRLVS